MSYAVSALDASGTPVLVAQKSAAGRRRQRIASQYAAPVGPVPVTATATLGLQLAVTLSRGSIWPTYQTSDGQLLPVTFAEKAASRQLKATTDGQQLTRVFLVHGTDDPAAAKDIGPKVGDLDDVLPTFICEDRTAVWFASGGEVANIVQITCTYSNAGAPPSGGSGQEPTFSYDFGAESEHVDRALAQVHYGGTPERVGDLINVTDEEVQGTEINAPILDLVEEHIFSEAEFSPSMRRALRDHMQKTNSAAWREFAIGEALFVGASARKQSKRWYVTFQFRIRRNEESLAFTVYSKRGIAQPQSVVKLGWQYLWVESIRLPGAADPTKIRIVPHAVHVATVYDSVDFSLLGIGSDPLP
jgi:hypothetical protein